MEESSGEQREAREVADADIRLWERRARVCMAQ